MSKIRPNEPCPCGSDFKYKKCCALYIKGRDIDNAERLLRARYSAYVNNEVSFIWETLHPESPRKLNDTRLKFEREFALLGHLSYKSLKLLDANFDKPNQAIIVYWVQVFEGEHDISFLEEGVFKRFEGKWYFFDGLRRSSNRLGCLPESIKIGDLETLFLHDSQYN